MNNTQCSIMERYLRTHESLTDMNICVSKVESSYLLLDFLPSTDNANFAY